MSRKRVGAGLLIVVLGLLTLAMPVMKMSGSHGHAGHSQQGQAMQEQER